MKFIKSYKVFELVDYVDIAPYGVIKFSDNKILVGDMHQIPIELSSNLIDEIVNVANTHGYYGEGIGLTHNEAITKSNFYDRLDPDKHMGSWDKMLANSGEIPKDKEYMFLYSLFSNPKQNHRLEMLLNNTDEGDSIFDVLLKTIPDWSAEMGQFNLGEKDLTKFLKEISERDYDFLEMSELYATKDNLSKFLDIGENLQWPETKEDPVLWQKYPYMAGKFARESTIIRDRFLINMGPGVYFVGAGHLADIVDMPEAKELGLELIGGEKIYSSDVNETIKVPIEVGDTVLGGRFKNKKIKVKKIGKNKKGDITINDKPLLKFRIVKEFSNFHKNN